MDYKEAMNVVYFASGVAGEAEKTDKGTFIVRGVPVFKSGSFTDSAGKRRTWDDTSLDQIAANFHTLRDNDLFKDVPLRTDHDRAVANIAGYLVGMNVDGSTLLADLEFTEPDAYEKWKRGTFRARSLEVGPYQTNDEQLFWPVAKGLAFVDIPAVEGLHSKSDTEVAPEPENKETTPVPETTEKTDQQFTIRGVPTTDATSIQKYIDTLEKDGAPEPQSFRLAGVEETDPEKVQKHIDAQDQALKEIDLAGRSDFVKQLAEDNKIAAPQVDATVEFVESLSVEQFAAYRKNFEDAPKTAPVGPTVGNRRKTEHTDDTSQVSEKEDLEATVAQFRRANVSEEKIKEMPSYKRLQELSA